jgi:hypothetical protein
MHTNFFFYPTVVGTDNFGKEYVIWLDTGISSMKHNFCFTTPANDKEEDFNY